MLSAKTLAGHGQVRGIGALGTYATGLALSITAPAAYSPSRSRTIPVIVGT